MNAISFIYTVLALLVLVRTVCMASKLSARAWRGHLFLFGLVAASNSMLAAGALSVLLGCEYSTLLLLAGAAGKLVSERRREHA